MSAIRVITHLIEVNVIVNDKHGNPITGLTEDDFVLVRLPNRCSPTLPLVESALTHGGRYVIPPKLS